MRPAEMYPVGDFLEEELRERGWTRATFAERSGLEPAIIDDLATGGQEVTTAIADALGRTFGTTAGLWVMIDLGYRRWRENQPDD